MKFWEAMRELEAGKKVRQTHDPIGLYFYKKNDSVILMDNGKSYNKDTSPIGIFILKEWELHEEPDQLLSFAEVVKGLKEGKKFKRKHWRNWVLEAREDLIFLVENKKKGLKCPRQLSDFQANDWVEVL